MKLPFTDNLSESTTKVRAVAHSQGVQLGNSTGQSSTHSIGKAEFVEGNLLLAGQAVKHQFWKDNKQQ